MGINVKRGLSLFLSIIMVFSCFIILGQNNNIKAKAETTYDYGLTEKIKDGAILHAWCWSFNTIKDNLEDIARAGYSSVQTSPINEVYKGENGGLDINGHGKWYYHYQPVLYTIGNYQLGTKSEFEELCKEAEKYNIKIIVDVVANHCSSNWGAISNEIKNIPGGAFHEDMGMGNFTNRYLLTQGKLLGLYDLNTQNPNVQQMILNYLKDCVAAGASGFRYDAAKHTELPDDEPYEGIDYASNFWPIVLENGSEFQYGEILQGGAERLEGYAEYMSVTSSNYGGTVRSAVKNNNFSTRLITDYRVNDVSADKLVTWVESHDNYTGDNTWRQLDNEMIRLAWALITSRESTTPLFFNRPDGSTQNDPWGKNKIGPTGDDNFKHPEVVAVNRFRNAMVGEPEKLINPGDNESVLIVERGNKGLVIINLSDKDINISHKTSLKDEKYNNHSNNDKFTVEKGVLKGKVNSKSVAVIYKEDESIVRIPKVGISIEGGEFHKPVTVKLTSLDTDYAAYKINNGEFIEYTSGDEITFGEDTLIGNTVKITLKGINDSNKDYIALEEYKFIRVEEPDLSNETIIYYNNSETKWDEVYLYAYTRNGGTTVNNGSWPGVKMEDLGSNYYRYIINNEWDYAFIIYNNGTSDEQIPEDIGFRIEKSEKKIFKEDGLVNFDGKIPEPEPEPEPHYGDVDLNSTVNVKDATLIQNYLAEIKTLTKEQIINGSVINGKNLSISDATTIQKYVADIITEFPVESILS